MTKDDVAALLKGITPVLREKFTEVHDRLARLERASGDQRLRALEDRCARQAAVIEKHIATIKALEDTLTTLRIDVMAIQVRS